MTSQPALSRSPDRGLVIALGESTEVTRVGGKAAALARAAAAGHAVPDGFVVTTEAPGQGRAAIAEEVGRAVAALGGGPVAVRSSAVGEDGRRRSFAGQLETELSVPAAGVLDAIERCWASASAMRVLRYAGAPGAVAVIVQRMVDATQAGVAFSADPRTGERDGVVIEAIHGLGDRLVSGAADPEAWRITAAGGERTRGPVPVLTEALATRVATLARQLETLFGGPQDLEWAFAGDALYLLQARPITALPAAPVEIPIDVPRGGWDRDDHHAVLSPLGWVWFQPYPAAMAAAMRELGMPLKAIEPRLIGGHLYLRLVMPGGDSSRPPPRWVLWLVTRLLPSMRRAERLAQELLERETYARVVDRWEHEIRPTMRREIRELFVEDPTTLGDGELLAKIGRALALTARGLAFHAQLNVTIFALGKLVLFATDHLGWSSEQVHAVLAELRPTRPRSIASSRRSSAPTATSSGRGCRGPGRRCSRAAPGSAARSRRGSRTTGCGCCTTIPSTPRSASGRTTCCRSATASCTPWTRRRRPRGRAPTTS